MKRYYIVEVNGNPIIYFGTIQKVKIFSETRLSDYREASIEEKEIIKKEGLLHLQSLKVEKLEKFELEDDENINDINSLDEKKDIPNTDESDNSKSEGKIDSVKENDSKTVEDKKVVGKPKTGKSPKK